MINSNSSAKGLLFLCIFITCNAFAKLNLPPISGDYAAPPEDPPVDRPTGWTERGNGGNMVYCPSLNQYWMYDAFESKYNYDFDLRYPQVSTNQDNKKNEDLELPLQIAQSLVDRLQSVDKSRFDRYSIWLKQFKDESRFIDNIELFSIPDSGIGFLPRGCTLHQLIIQRDPQFPRSKRYTVANDYWRLLPTEQKAVAILHEIIYRDLLSHVPESNNSEAVRYLNGMILSNEINKISSSEYAKLIHQIFTPTDFGP